MEVYSFWILLAATLHSISGLRGYKQKSLHDLVFSSFAIILDNIAEHVQMTVMGWGKPNEQQMYLNSQALAELKQGSPLTKIISIGISWHPKIYLFA